MNSSPDDQSQGSDDEIFADEVERTWAESTSIGGVDPGLMDARRGEYRPEEPPEASAFSPLLIPFSAIVTGPIIAALITLLTDGRPPKARQAVAVLSIGALGWLLNYALNTLGVLGISPGLAASLHLAGLFAIGLGLWALYIYWIKGRRGQDQKTLTQSVVLLVALSAAYWFGQDTTWWTFLGR